MADQLATVSKQRLELEERIGILTPADTRPVDDAIEIQLGIG